MPGSNLRRAAKDALNGAAIVLVLPAVAVYRLLALRSMDHRIRAFQSFSQFFSLIPGLPGVFLRRAFLHLTILRSHGDCSVGFGTLFTTHAVELGRNVYIGVYCNIGDVTIGDDVLIGSNVTLLSGKHQHRFDRLDVPIRLQGGTYERISIGTDVWIGNAALVMADVGDHAVVAAGAVVVHDVPPHAIVGGNPARVLAVRGAKSQTP